MQLKDFDFRLWHKPSKSFVEIKSALFDRAYNVPTDDESVEIELWSGFYDCKRVKIYENDIVFCNNATYQVVYERGVFWVKNNKHNFIMAQAIHYEPLEVIGNIHENADLLEEEKVFIKKCKYADIECLCGK